MKKTALILALTVFTAISFTSCRKCITCKAYERSTNAVINTQEYCGPKQVVDDDESFYEDLWNDSYYYAECK